jgi:hypothetical protein
LTCGDEVERRRGVDRGRRGIALVKESESPLDKKFSAGQEISGRRFDLIRGTAKNIVRKYPAAPHMTRPLCNVTVRGIRRPMSREAMRRCDIGVVGRVHDIKWFGRIFRMG